MQIPLVQHMLVPPECEGKEVGCAALSKRLTAGCYIRPKPPVSGLADDMGEDSLSVAEHV